MLPLARRAVRVLALFAALCAPAAVARAQDELGLGKMWTFERPPLAYLQKEYGFAPDEAWWNRMRLASLRFGTGCSASFVSAQGLILTNHHCVREMITAAQGERDWVRDGFVAAELADEVRLPKLTVQQLVAMRDVTAEVDRDVGAAMDAAAVEAVRAKNRERLLAQARVDQPALEPQLVKLFQGAIWQLYQYRVFDDVRLVMAPHLQISHFGGDPDNFVYPRYAVDFSFCRAYVDGKPADTHEWYFPWSDGPSGGELVFLTGNPGRTERMHTKAQLEFQRDVRYPRIREMIDARLVVLREFAARDADSEKRLRTSILMLENAQKLWRGEHEALLDPAFMARKQKAEVAFRARAAKTARLPDLQVWEKLAALMTEKRALDAPVSFHSAGGLPLLLRALALVEYAATADQALAQKARDSDCGVDPVPAALFADHLARAKKRLPADDPYLAVMLHGLEPAAATERLLRDSRLCDGAFLESLIAGGRAAIDASRDPALVAARVVNGLASADGAANRRVDAAESANGATLAKLAFEVYGTDVTPDATFTLRWSDGLVLGYDYNGTRAPWRTVFHGLFARSAEFDNQHPFDLPREWQLAKDRIDMSTPVDFVCTVDSTGGNSGSPVLNKKLELVGLLFDGNIESMANEFLYGERVERSVCVHPQGIVEALRKVYSASRLLRELGR
jgi:hypothetical protein